MTIRVQNLSINPTTVGGIRPGSQSNSFKDLFTRANANNLGTQWGFFTYFNTNASVLVQSAIINANKCRFQNNASAGSDASIAFPMPLQWMTQVVSGQFSEFTCTAMSAAYNIQAAVVLNPNLSNTTTGGYYNLNWVGPGPGGALSINRYIFTNLFATGIVSASLSTLSGATANVGDVLRLQAQNVAGTWTLTAFKNGVSLGSATDNTIPQGMPGMAVIGAGSAVTVDVSEYAAGTA